MKDIISIDIVLENCEVIAFKREHIGHFYISDIKRAISRVAMNSVSEYLSADEVYLQISSKANEYSSFETSFSEGGNPFDRMRISPDITWIYVKYEDGSEEGISVNWGGDSDYMNDYQTSAINEHTGDLYIVISPKETAQSFYSDELDEEDADFWGLYED